MNILVVVMMFLLLFGGAFGAVVALLPVAFLLLVLLGIAAWEGLCAAGRRMTEVAESNRRIAIEREATR